MSRNLKKDYLKKLLAITTNNGYKIDLANYIYNPSLAHEYPHLVKVIEETEHEKIIARVYYQKHYDGTGDYIYQKHNEPKEKNSGWYFVRESHETIIDRSNRFNLNKLIAIAEDN